MGKLAAAYLSDQEYEMLEALQKRFMLTSRSATIRLALRVLSESKMTISMKPTTVSLGPNQSPREGQ